jgi:hypothetical protein
MTGNFLRISRRQPDGRWFMTRDNFNGSDGNSSDGGPQ